MEKTISINLSGQNFQIEEDAYKKLSEYLESIKRHCGAGADSVEVIADIENSMAEKLKASLTPYKEVVTKAEIDSLIKIMGTVEDFDREVGGSEEKNENQENKDEANNENEIKIKRKLYRDTDNAIIGGVASGLGAYFDIDPVLFRIIFCALVFAGGSAFLLYILLWIAMPEAKTAHQKLEMQGQAPTLAAFKNLAKTGKQLGESWRESWKKRWEKFSTIDKIINLPFFIINGLFLALRKIWNALWPIVKFCFGLFLATFSFIGLGIVGIGSLFLVLYNNSSYRLSFIPISELTGSVPYVWMILTGFLSLAIPAAMLLFGGISILRRKNLINFSVGSILVGIWMVSGIVFCSFCLRYYPELQNKFSSYPIIAKTEKAVDMKDINEIQADSRYLNIIVKADTSTPATISGRWVDLENIEIRRDSKKLIIEEKPFPIDNICLNCDFRTVTLKIATSSDLKINVTDDVYVRDETRIIKDEALEDEDLRDEALKNEALEDKAPENEFLKEESLGN